jgi:hypothetical protein
LPKRENSEEAKKLFELGLSYWDGSKTLYRSHVEKIREQLAVIE